MSRPIRVATDVGGTFTDLVYIDVTSGQMSLVKESTTPPQFERGIMSALAKAAIDERSEVEAFTHGTTMVINALTERSGAPTALITTAGFRDVLEITRANRRDLFNLRYAKPEPFVLRSCRFEVRERMHHSGDILVPLVEEDVVAAVEAALAAGATALAICFLHAYANPAHEQRCAELVRSLAPELVVTMSHEVSGEWREYERSSTAVLNAYVQGTATAYINALGRGLDDLGVTSCRQIMQSNGGTVTFEQAKHRPIGLVESGPVAGMMGAAAIGNLINAPNLIALDIGGTTAKTSLIEAGTVKVNTDYRLNADHTSPGTPIKVPVVDIVEIGAGGGSIAWLDDSLGLHVGPRSAGAVPGPACYPEGGDEPTVTDANLIAGRINPSYFLGGEISVSLERAKVAMERIAEPLGIDIDQAALGVIRVANARMVNALKLVSVRRGHDPRDFDLIAFGGGGSMHATALAAELQMGRVIIPPMPGLFSAWGMLTSEERGDWVRTRVLGANAVDHGVLAEIWSELEALATTHFAAAATKEPESLVFTRSADLRYKGQEHTVKVPMPGGVYDAALLADVICRFSDLHKRQYTFTLDLPVEFVTFHLTATRPRAGLLAFLAPTGERGGRPLTPCSQRSVHFDELGRHHTNIYRRDALSHGDHIIGPAMIEEPSASTLIFPGDHVHVDGYGNLIVAIGEGHKASAKLSAVVELGVT